jgi:hypothetical protein
MLFGLGQRKLANPAFSYVSVRTLHDIMVEEVEVMFQRIDAATPATALDPDDLFSKLALVRRGDPLRPSSPPPPAAVNRC